MNKDTNDFKRKTLKKLAVFNNQNKKIKSKNSVALKILASFIIIILIFTGVGYLIINNILGKFGGVNLDKNNLGITSDMELSKYKDYNKILNIALFGIDSTDASTTGRADATMVATLDPVHNKLKITSFMRDSYVAIDGYGYDKLNHSYAFGGAELAINTLNQNFGLNIQESVAVDFATLPVIIDSLGGLELTIKEDEIQYLNSYIYHLNNLNNTSSPIITSAGKQQLNGTQALAYTRIRYTDGGDYERTHRQRIVLSALFEKCLALPSSQYVSIINKISPYIETSLSTSDILSLGTKIAAMGLNGVKLEQERFPLDSYSEGTSIDGIYYLTFDETATKEQVKDYIFSDKLPEENSLYE